MQDNEFYKWKKEKIKVMLKNQNEFFNDFNKKFDLFFIIQKFNSNTRIINLILKSLFSHLLAMQDI